MSNNTVLITGLGSISPLGNDTAEFWRGMLGGDRVPVEREEPGFNRRMLNNTLCYPVCAPHAADGAATGFALTAARQALADAGLGRADRITIGVGIGTGAGDSDVAEAQRQAGVASLPISPFGVAERVAQVLQCEGPAFTLGNACSASLYACAHAVDLLQAGCADAILLIGTECVGRVTQASLERMFALDAEICRPFDANRRGTVLGEGAAALLLERVDSAAARGARSYGEIKSYAANCDAHHPTSPREDGARIEAVAREALMRAGLNADSVEVIVPHGTGTPLNDATESAMLRRVFGPELERIPVCPIKSKIGHGAGAAGAFSLLTACLMMRDQMVPPISSRHRSASGCKLRFALGAPLRHSMRHALINAYAFGGNNISMIVGAPS